MGRTTTMPRRYAEVTSIRYGSDRPAVLRVAVYGDTGSLSMTELTASQARRMAGQLKSAADEIDRRRLARKLARPGALKAWWIHETSIHAGATFEDALASYTKLTGITRDEASGGWRHGEQVDLAHKLRWEDDKEETVADVLGRMKGPGVVADWE